MSLSQTDKAISPQLLVSDVKKSISHIYTCERFETKVFVASHAYSMCSQSQSRNLHVCTTYIEDVSAKNNSDHSFLLLVL